MRRVVRSDSVPGSIVAAVILCVASGFSSPALVEILAGESP